MELVIAAVVTPLVAGMIAILQQTIRLRRENEMQHLQNKSAAARGAADAARRVLNAVDGVHDKLDEVDGKIDRHLEAHAQHDLAQFGRRRSDKEIQ